MNRQTALEDYLRRQFGNTPIKGSALTIGIEHEFFLLNSEGRPVSHTEGQNFLRALAKRSQWYVREEITEAGEKIIWRVSKETHDGRFTAVKYDHHPHLFEIAFAYEDNLMSLHSETSQVLIALHETAQILGLRISSNAVLDIDAMDETIVSPLSYFRDLRHYRSLLLRRRFGPQIPSSQNYAATIVATQFHIGGISWWDNELIIEKLYCLEPVILDLVAILNSNNSPGAFFKQRWHGYHEVFEGFPLVGFPKLSSWTLKNWAEALLRSPMAGGPSDSWAAKDLSSLARQPFPDFKDFLAAVRDLQLIRPKLYGTLEFRADPSMGTVDKILTMAALRLGLANAIACGLTIESISFKSAHDLWWRKVTSHFEKASALELSKVLQLAKNGLTLRNRGENRYLTSFDASVRMEAA